MLVSVTFTPCCPVTSKLQHFIFPRPVCAVARCREQLGETMAIMAVVYRPRWAGDDGRISSQAAVGDGARATGEPPSA